MIDPNNTSTIRVGELPLEPFNLTDNIPHEIGTDLKRGTVQQLSDLIASVIEVAGGVGFRAISVTDGQTLPTTTQQEFILVGKGTYFNVAGGETIVLNEELNALVSNGSFWFVGVEIPVNVELAGITQEIRQGFLTTTPSEDAVFKFIQDLDLADKENASNKQNSLAVDGTGTKFPTVDAINERYNLVENIRLSSDFTTNLFLGEGAGQDNTPLSTTIGRQNTFLGVNAGRFNTTGYARTDIGYNAGYFNTTGDGNCNIGYQSGFLNISGNYNTNVGTDAGARNRGSRNSFWGWHSGFGFSTFSTGEDNHILGYETAINLLTGFGNNGHGGRVFYNLTDGYNNTAMGDLSGFNLTTGNSNSLYGRDSGFALDSQVSNSIFGNRAGYNIKGNFNTILGEFAGFDLTSGNGNVYIGQGSGNNALQKVDATETIVIGSSAYATKNNQVVLGRNGGITETILRGKVLVGTETNNNVDDLQINGTVSANPATLSNQVVVKSQLDLKANLASPALTGTPTAPTATAGTNTTQIATTAFVNNKENTANKQNSLAADGTGVKFPTVDAVNAEVVKLTQDQTVLGLKTLESFGSVPNLKLINNNTADRDNYIQFENPSAAWQLGMKGAASTLFQIKAGDTPYYSVDRFSGNTSIGYNAPAGTNTLFLQDLSSDGSTELIIKEGIGQGNSDFLNVREYGGNNIFRVNHQGSLERRKNLNRLFIFSGDSWSNDVVENIEAGDWPTYFLQRGYLSGESDYLVTAVGGRQVATMLANYATEIRPYAKTKIEQERTISILGGINDLFGSRSAAEIYNDLKSMWLNARNDGFKVIAFTICPSVDLTPTKETQRLSLNNLILSDRTLYDFLIRTEILFPNAADTTYFNVDGVHLNSLGAKILGNAVYDYIYTDKYIFSVEPTQPASEGSGTKLIPNSVIDNLTLIGIPTAPTPTTTTGIANKSYVDGLDSGNVKTTGNQNILGIKSITNISAGITNGFAFTNTGTEANNGVLRVRNTNSGIGLYSTNEGGGNGIVSNTTTSGTGLNYVGQNNGTNTFTVDKLGVATISGGAALNNAVPRSQLLYTSQTITANKTVTIAEFVNNNELILSVNATSGNITITLPTFTALQGYKVTVKKMDSSANSVLIQGVGGINIDFQPNLTVSGQGGISTVGANLTQYIIL